MESKLFSLFAMTLKFLFKEKAKDKAKLILALTSLLHEIKELIKELRKFY